MKITKLITRSSIALLALCSTSVFAGAIDLGPDFTLHKAKVNLKVSASVAGDFGKETIKDKDVIDALGGDSDDKDQELVLAVPCDVDDAAVIADVIGLFVFDKELEIVEPGTGAVALDVLTEAVQLKNGDPKKADLVMEAFDEVLTNLTITAIIATGTAKFGKIGNKIADEKVGWDKDTICASKYDGKSTAGFVLDTTGAPIEGSVMKGTISGGNAKLGVDCVDIGEFVGFGFCAGG